MIITITSFSLDTSFSMAKTVQAFTDSAEKFLKMPGLIHKYFLLSEDGKSAGAVYLWQSRLFAEAFFTDAWRKFIQQKYGDIPKVQYFNCPLEVDNFSATIVEHGL